MGLIDRLRQEEEQATQATLARQTEYAERERVKAGKIETEQKEKFKTFIDDSIRKYDFRIEQNSLLIDLLDYLIKYGYKEYLISIYPRAGLRSSVLFRKDNWKDYYGYYDDDAWKKWSELSQATDLCLERRELSQASDLSLWRRKSESGIITMRTREGSSTTYLSERLFDPLLGESFYDPSAQFFYDNPFRSEQQKQSEQQKLGFFPRLLRHKPVTLNVPTRFSEPEEVGIGFRFAIPAKYEEPSYNPWYTRSETYNTFYVRIHTPHHAIVTGALIQEEVDLSDVKAFDNALEQAYTHPFSNTIHEERTGGMKAWGDPNVPPGSN